MAAGLVLAMAPYARAAEAGAAKVLRTAFLIAETGFDPVRVNDLYSRTINAHIFEGLYRYDHLARPPRIKPLTAAALPQVSADHRVWTVRIQPGIFFADDPAFNGRPRELTAADVAYSFKRVYDPATRSPHLAQLQDEGLLGLQALRDEALARHQPFDYDRPVEGLRVLDRYTVQFVLREPRPRFLYTLAEGDLFGAVAREVVEAYGDAIMAHPVGTGPFRLKQWRRSALIVLERNPRFRPMVYDAEPNADDAQGQDWAARFKGRRLPMVDEVQVSIIEESQPRWLAFLNGQIDLVSVPLEFIPTVVVNGQLAAPLARRGIEWRRYVNPDVVLTYFNMDDPVVGGHAPAQVALRRAINLGIDIGREIQQVRRGQAIAAQTLLPPGTFGHDPALKTENSDFDPARANALLDLYGYRDRNADGWRERPDGQPLVLQMATQPSALDRQFNELFAKDMQRLGLAVRFVTAQWPEQMKAARAGTLQMWSLGSTATQPDGQSVLERLYSRSAGKANLARFRHDGFDRLYEQALSLPDGPARRQLLQQASLIGVAFAPYKVHVHRLVNDLNHPWVIGFRRPSLWNAQWQYVDLDLQRRAAAR